MRPIIEPKTREEAFKIFKIKIEDVTHPIMLEDLRIIRRELSKEYNPELYRQKIGESLIIERDEEKRNQILQLQTQHLNTAYNILAEELPEINKKIIETNKQKLTELMNKLKDIHQVIARYMSFEEFLRCAKLCDSEGFDFENIVELYRKSGLIPSAFYDLEVGINKVPFQKYVKYAIESKRRGLDFEGLATRYNNEGLFNVIEFTEYLIISDECKNGDYTLDDLLKLFETYKEAHYQTPLTANLDLKILKGRLTKPLFEEQFIKKIISTKLSLVEMYELVSAYSSYLDNKNSYDFHKRSGYSKIDLDFFEYASGYAVLLHHGMHLPQLMADYAEENGLFASNPNQQSFVDYCNDLIVEKQKQDTKINS